MMPAPSIFTFPFTGVISSTRPRFPLSRPAMIITWSFFLIFARFIILKTSKCLDRKLTTCAISNYLRRERNYFHKILVAQLPSDGSKHTRANWCSVFFNQHGRVLIESDIRSVLATHFLAGTHDHGVLHGALLDRAIRRSFFHGDLDSISETGNRAGRAANTHDHLDSTCSRIVSDLKRGLHLNHDYLAAFCRISTTRQRFLVDSGRVSTIRTRSPVLDPKSSWAINREVRRT